jgi:phosphoribosylamine---glycine ligase
MNVLLIGSGGREHALAYALSKSDRLDKLFCAPGNPGIAEFAKCVDLDVTSNADVIAFCEKKDVGFVVVGPEGPLVAGLTDALAEAGIRHFGPSSRAAQLEGSKGYTKDLCRAHNIPTAAYGRFDDAAAAKAYLKDHALPVVIKADGLAAGKGVTIAATHDEAAAAVDACLAMGILGRTPVAWARIRRPPC